MRRNTNTEDELNTGLTSWQGVGRYFSCFIIYQSGIKVRRLRGR